MVKKRMKMRCSLACSIWVDLVPQRQLSAKTPDNAAVRHALSLVIVDPYRPSVDDSGYTLLVHRYTASSPSTLPDILSPLRLTPTRLYKGLGIDSSTSLCIKPGSLPSGTHQHRRLTLEPVLPSLIRHLQQW